ncbi:aflatoxin B1 aldehyde reductase [Acrasis kona]|uniref:Aflatoxin B1 aldehyde reductase n=1 Tax=Acrasis kona TaxID=1008807 RepID=A0AAW2ZAM8_9EUKA
MSNIKKVFGTSSFGGVNLNSIEKAGLVLKKLRANNINELDTAARYGRGQSEQFLGELSAHKDFFISTKANTISQGTAKKELLINGCEESLRKLKQDSVYIYYLHGPDRETSFEEQAAALNQLHKKRYFERLGLSNFTADEVQKFYDICKKEGYVLPSVYQGNYNAVTRNNEQELFPVLRKLNINFYAYSPLAGGLFAKSLDELNNPKPGGRFHPESSSGPMYRRMYINETFLNALEIFQKLCQEENIKPSQAAFSWLRHHSILEEGDAIILGGSTIEQIDENLSNSTGHTLSEKIYKGLEEMWKCVADKAPNYHF